MLSFSRLQVRQCTEDDTFGQVVLDVEINSIAVARTDWIAKQAHEDRDRNSKADDHRREKLVLAGCIQFLNVSMRYQPDAPLVLRNVSSSISAGTKVGICGRTGSVSVLGSIF